MRSLQHTIERALDTLGSAAVRLRLAWLPAWLARPLLVGEDLRPEPFIVALCGGCRFNGRLNEATCIRVEYAVRLFQDGLAPHLILSGGRKTAYRPSCAPRMKALAERLGVRAANITVEDRSSRTLENAREVAQILRARGASSVLLVTSPLHMRRAKLCFEKQGVTVSCAPVREFAETLLVKELVYEYVGLAYYRAHGWV